MAPLWENEFCRLWGTLTFKLQDICSSLHVGNDTIHRQAKKLGLSEDRKQAATDVQHLSTTAVSMDTNLIQTNRKSWSQMLGEHPNSSLEDLRKIIPTLYNDLLRFDAKWLNDHKPARKTNPIESVDWQTRDQDLAAYAPELAREICNQPGKPVRVTLNSIAKRLGWGEGSIQRDQDNLPTAYPVLLGLVESHEDFAIRRVWYTFNRHMAKCVPLTRSDLIKRAGLNSTVQTERVLSAVDEAIKSRAHAIAISDPPQR